MYNRYKDKEKRRKYLREWRKKNRERLNKYLSAYLTKTGKIYYSKSTYKDSYKSTYKNSYKTKGERGEDYYGTCGIGRKYEKIALEFLKGSIDCNSKSFLGKWDIEWNGLKIDVKMRNLSKRGCWGFTTHKNPEADYFLCFCVRGNKIEKTYFIPAKIFGTSLSISRNNKKNNKYSKYLLLVFSRANVN